MDDWQARPAGQLSGELALSRAAVAENDDPVHDTTKYTGGFISSESQVRYTRLTFHLRHVELVALARGLGVARALDARPA